MANTCRTRVQENHSPHAVPVLDTVDELVAAVPWGRWRSVLVYRREHAGRTWVRLRTFNKHRIKGCWYPSPRFFVVPQKSAADLAKAIEAAASGDRCGETPDWVEEFERQYAARFPPNFPKRGLG
jgi:hypothetical protein